MRKTLLFGSSLLFLTAAAQAQQNELDPVIVTASLNPLKTSQTGRNVVVIKGERFNQLPVHSLDELLRYLPGLEVQARGPMGAQSDIVLRGGTFQQVLVIVDGVRVNDPNTGHFSTYIPISPAEIDRIEILKGAASALYGSDAVGGVVHVITKSFAGKTAENRLQSAVQLTGGEYGFYGANAGLFAARGNTNFGVGILSNNTDGQPQRGMRGFVNATTVSGSVGRQFGQNWNVALRTAYDTRKFGAQNFYTTAVSDSAQETIKTFWNQLQAVRTVASNTLRLQVGYKRLSDSFSFNRRTPSNQNKTSLWQALLTNERRLGTNTVLTPGVQLISKRIASNDRGNHQVALASAFVVLNQQIGERFFVAPAARVEWNERAGWELLPQVNLAYRGQDFQLRGSAGRTIRDADFTERFNNYNKAVVTSGQRLGNPDLEAERSFSYEAGADYFFGSKLKASATVFQRDHKNLIDYVPTPYAEIPRKVNLLPAGTYALARNIAEVTTTGAEADLHFSQPLRNGGSLWATVGVVWLKSRSSNAVPSFYLSSHAQVLTTANLQYTGKRFALAANGLYKKRQPQRVASPAIAKVSTDYLVLNLKADVFLVPARFALYAQVDNILDRQYTDILGSQMPGRWFFAGARFSFTK